jgi:hypothetical protein
MKSNANDIRLIRPVDFFRLFIDVSYLPPARNPGSQVRHGNLLEIKEPGLSRSADLIRGCGNQEEFRHGVWNSPVRCPAIEAVGQSRLEPPPLRFRWGIRRLSL